MEKRVRMEMENHAHQNWTRTARWSLFFILLVFSAAFSIPNLIRAKERIDALRGFETVLAHLTANQFTRTIPCARQPAAAAVDREILTRLLPRLPEYPHRSAAYCLLADPAAALDIYLRQAANGDRWATLQAHYILTQTGDVASAQHILASNWITLSDLDLYRTALAAIDPQTDFRPIAIRALELSPRDPDRWEFWLYSLRRYEKGSDLHPTLALYLEGLKIQDRLGIRIGRSSILLRAGRIYQVSDLPSNLELAVQLYDQAFAHQDFLDSSDAALLRFYRGTAYRALRPQYTDAQILDEFQAALSLEPRNYAALATMASVYQVDLKQFDQAAICLDRLVEFYPKEPDAYLRQGNLYRAMGDLPRAAAAYERALALKPDWDVAQEKLDAVRAQMETPAP